MAVLPDPPTPTLSAIYAAYEAERGDGFREHLGASLIGKSCERALWYDFRWVTRARFPGRILRLFETGQLEEARLVRNLQHLRLNGHCEITLDSAPICSQHAGRRYWQGAIKPETVHHPSHFRCRVSPYDTALNGW